MNNTDIEQLQQQIQHLIEQNAQLVDKNNQLLKDNQQLKQQIEQVNSLPHFPHPHFFSQLAPYFLYFLEKLNESVALIKPNGECVFINIQGAMRLGFLPEQMINRNLFDFFPLEVRQHRQHYFNLVIQSQEILTFEDQRDKRWFEHTYYPLFDAQENLIYIAIFAYETTLKKQIENSLRQSEQRFNYAMQGSNEGIWDIDFNSGEVYFSPRCKQMLGDERTEFLNHPQALLNRLHPEDYLRVLEKQQTYLTKKISNYEIICRLQHRDGSYIPVLIRAIAVWNHYGEPSRLVGTLFDVTELQRAEHQRQAAEQFANTQAIRFKTVLETISDAIIVINQKGLIELINQATEQLFGYLAPELLQQPIEKLFIAGGMPLAQCLNLQRGCEIIGRHKQGKSLILLASMGIFEESQQKHFTLILHDISRQKAVEQELQRARELAESANLAKSNFLAMMSHEIRTPINGILGIIELLLNTNSNQIEQRHYLERVQQSMQHLLRVMSDILEFAQIGESCSSLQQKDFNLRSLLEETVELFAYSASTKAISLGYQYPSTLSSWVNGDINRLRQILNNLIGNALKFTQSGWVLLQVSLAHENDELMYLLFEVMDSGIGIAPETQANLFDIFQQVDQSTTRRFDGIGMGLAIVHRLVHLMGGELGVSSELNKGSCFWFKLALHKVSTPNLNMANSLNNETPSDIEEKFESPFKTPLHTETGRTIYILLAEDNLVNQEVAREVLQRMGCEVTVVSDGLAAVSAIRQSQFDLVLMDCHMPEMDGYTATQTIRQWQMQRGQVHTPIIALTANALPNDRNKCLEAGMDDYISKPFKAIHLRRVIEQWTKTIPQSNIETQAKDIQPTQHCEPILETHILEELALELNPQGVIKIIELFLRELPKYMQQMQEQLQQQAGEGLYLAAHKFKGASQNVGLQRTLQHCKLLEGYAKKQEFNQAFSEFLALEQTMNEAKSLLEQFCESLRKTIH